MRTATINRKTNETEISLFLNLDGKGNCEINSGCGFLDHMLTLFARHARFDLNLSCKGDTFVDDHHTVEDIGICLGLAVSEALGDKKGIVRYGDITLPMDEALILAATDISGRSLLCYNLNPGKEKVGTFDTELVEEFFYGFTRNANLTLHINQLSGSNAHHIIEGAFKAVARALKVAVKIDEDFADEVMSTKGVL